MTTRCEVYSARYRCSLCILQKWTM